MQNNLEVLKELIAKDNNSVSVILEMIKINSKKTDGYIMIKYRKGVITCIKSEKNIPLG